MTDVEFEFNETVLENEYNVGPRRVTREMIHNYAWAVGDEEFLYVDDEAVRGPSSDIIAPPALVVTLVDDWEPPDLDLKFDGTLYLAGYWVEPLAPVRAGDELRIEVRVTDVYPKTGRSGPMVFLRKEASFTNQDGVLVARVGASSVWRK